MISMKRTVAILAAAAMMVQPMSVLAATPGDNLVPQFEITDDTTTNSSVITTNAVTASDPAVTSDQVIDQSQTGVIVQDSSAGSITPGAVEGPTGDNAVISADPQTTTESTGTPDNTETVTGNTLPAATTTQSTGSFADNSGASSSSKTLPVVDPTDVEGIRYKYMTTPNEGNMEADPVLNLVPMGSYFIYDGSGKRLDWGTTSKNDSFAYSSIGFTSFMLEHANVGRWYYRTYSNGTGWGPWATSKEATPNQGIISAMQIRVKGYTHNLGDLYYRALLNDGTVTDWAKEGQAVGSIGDDRYIVGIKLALWKKGVQFFDSTEKPMTNASNEGVYHTSSGTIYVTADGRSYTGWGFDSDSNQYYFNDGVAVTGWNVVNGYNIYFDENGVALKDLSEVMGAPGAYALRINKATRTMYVLAQDSTGNFTIPYKTLMVTVGDDTPIGSFSIYEKYRWHFMHTDCYCQFLSRFKGHYLLHSLLYSRPDYNTMDAIYYNYMDDSMSGGCIRLRAVDCAWIYNNCPNGTTVTVYNDKWDKGPIEKDAIQQAIPRNQTFDPTDPLVTAAQDAAAKAAAEAAAAAAASETGGEPQ
ncbi:L,D-transpeptidase [Oribacterium sp. FC2011]|uniref:L,D-transpeptidase n=1 Tax=Oribacterium sp. FC2011 TaxID=1408311 RepID=UPI000A438A6D|nr:L,D-transpeptidase [Oribacterium sp. FC2011]